MQQFKIKVLEEGFKPVKATDGSAGFDVMSTIDVTIEPNAKIRWKIPLGFSVEMPPNYCCLLLPRSGNALNYGLTLINSPGLADSDFRNEYCALMVNHGDKAIRIEQGQRIAQLLFLEIPSIELVESDELSETTRKGGFGSTDKPNNTIEACCYQGEWK